MAFSTALILVAFIMHDKTLANPGELISNLLDLGDFDPVFLIEHKLSAKIRNLLEIVVSKREVPWIMFSASLSTPATMQFSTPNCDLNDLDVTHTAATKRPKLFFIWPCEVSSLWTVLDALSNTITNCSHKIKPGMFHGGNAFVFYLEGDANKTRVLKDNIFSTFNIRRHGRVAVFSNNMVAQGHDKLLVSRFNIYRSEVVSTQIWSPSKLLKQFQDVYTEFPMEGFEFRVGAIPYASLIDTDYKITSDDPKELSKKYRLYEGQMLQVICQKLDCTMSYHNPPGFHWGTVKNGEASGLFKYIVEDKVDFVLGAILADYERSRVSIYSAHIAYGDALTLASPKGTAYRSVLVLIRPLLPSVWIFLGCSILVAPFLFWCIATLEEMTKQIRLSHWTHFPSATWYAFGTFIGESIHRQTSSKGGWALRWLCCSWLFFAFLVTSSYGGNLRAFLTTPDITDPINSVKELVESGLPWYMVLYGEGVEEELSNSKDPLIQKFWKKKRVLQHSSDQYKEFLNVYEEKSVMVQWYPPIDAIVSAAFTLPNGERLIHIPESIGLTPVYYTVWAFHPLRPWIGQFNRFLSCFVESDILYIWKHQAKLQRVQKLKNSLKQQGIETPAMKVIHSHTEKFRQMSVDDFFGVFATYALLLLISLVLLLLELVVLRTMRGKDRPSQGTVIELMAKSQKKSLMPPENVETHT